jgi:uracil-DNA glycosylase
MTKSFGAGFDDRGLSVEKHQGACSHDELARIASGYRALDGGSERYSVFLSEGATCRRCLDDPDIPEGKRPLPFLCGTAPFDHDDAVEAIDRAHKALEPYRRVEAATAGSIRFNPADRLASVELRGFLDDHRMKGMSIGHCGWSDMTMRLRGAQMALGTRLMILGNDWYPLTSCSRFLADGYQVDGTILKFLRRLKGYDHQPSVAEFDTFVRDQRVYFGNALMCYRTGKETTGTKNLSRKSFVNCQDHLKRHVGAVAPEILVTFGKNSCAAVARIGTPDDADDADTIIQLREVDRKNSFIATMEKHHRNRGPTGIRLTIKDREVVFVPLCHPSLPNRYEGDYEALRIALR